MNLIKNSNRYLWLVLIALLALGQFQRLELWPGVPFYVHDLVIGVWTLGLAGYWLKTQSGKLKFKQFLKQVWLKYKLELGLLLWIGLGWAVALVTGQLGLRAILYTARFGVYLSWFCLLKKTKALNQSWWRTGFLSLGGLVAWLGILQYLFLPDVRFLKILGWDDHYYRLISTQFDPQFAGLILVLTLLVWEMTRVKSVWVKWLGQVVLVAAIAMTFSRSTFLSLAVALVGVIIWGVSKVKRPKLMILRWLSLPLVLGAVVLVLPKPGGEGVNLARTSSIETRVESSYSDLVDLKGSEWFWGEGLFNTHRASLSQADDYERSYHAALADNILILLLQAVGVVGGALVLAVAVKWLPRWWQTQPELVLAMAVITSHALFNNSWFQPFVFLMMLGFAAL